MPRGDRTGPFGMGPVSGRGAGLCAGFNMPGHAGSGRGFGYAAQGSGRCGMGRGSRHMFYAAGMPGWMRFGGPGLINVPVQVQDYTEEDELDFLKSRAEYLKKLLDDVNRRLNELEEGEQ